MSNVHGLVRWYQQKKMYHAHCLAFGRWQIGYLVMGDLWIDRMN